jgi:hypothetical protein
MPNALSSALTTQFSICKIIWRSSPGDSSDDSATYSTECLSQPSTTNLIIPCLKRGLILFTIRSERQLVEHLQANLLYQWFLDLGIQETI